MGAALDALKQAVTALYSGDWAQQTQANAWLASWQQSQEAWAAAFALLAVDQPQDLQFFAATVLARKVKAEWPKLEVGHRQSLNQAIRCAADGWRYQGAASVMPRAGRAPRDGNCAMLTCCSPAGPSCRRRCHGRRRPPRRWSCASCAQRWPQWWALVVARARPS